MEENDVMWSWKADPTMKECKLHMPLYLKGPNFQWKQQMKFNSFFGFRRRIKRTNLRNENNKWNSTKMILIDNCLDVVNLFAQKN